jgi:hypothetical protein
MVVSQGKSSQIEFGTDFEMRFGIDLMSHGTERPSDWFVGCEGDGGGHVGGWLAGLTGASNSYWKPWAPISLTHTLSLYIYIHTHK